MDNNVRVFTRGTLKIIGLQVLIGGVVGAGFFVTVGYWRALSYGYGVLIGVTGTAMLAGRIARAGRMAEQDPRKSMQMFYLGAVQRFVLIAALLVCGPLVFKFDPPALLIGLCVPQLAYLVGLRGLRHEPGEK